MKSLTLVAATALAGAVMSPAAKADVIFGSSQNAACTTASGSGFVCNSANVTFTGTLGEQVVAHGFPGAPGPAAGTSNLTQKLIAPTNGLSESGLGVQANNTSTTCTDSDCEIFPPQSVSVTASSSIIHDAVIGSVQAGETFNFFVQTSLGGAFTQLNPIGTPIGSDCAGAAFGVTPGPVAQTCQWNAPTDQFRFGVAVQAVAGDELLTSISSVPGPIVGAGLPGLVAACGGLIALARRRRRQMA
jgi:hypothetical protein